ncbi:MAG: hypothetical protein Q9223_003925 [Gallowayella weberi]
MSDDLRKGVGSQVQEKLTPDSQKSTTEQGSEKLTSLGDKAAGSLQPDDSKSTSQEASDKARSGADDAQNTLKGLSGQAQNTFNDATNKVSENLPSGGQAQDTGKSYVSQAQDLAADAQKKLSESTPSSGEAQDTGKTYLQQGQELASSAAKVVSDTLSGTKANPFSCIESELSNHIRDALKRVFKGIITLTTFDRCRHQDLRIQ